MKKNFWIALLKRCAWTFCESLLAMIPIGVGLEEVSWLHVLSVSALAAVISALKSIVAGMPEVSKDECG